MIVVTKRVLSGIHYYIDSKAAEQFDEAQHSDQMRLALMIVDSETYHVFKNVLLSEQRTLMTPTEADCRLQALAESSSGRIAFDTLPDNDGQQLS